MSEESTEAAEAEVTDETRPPGKPLSQVLAERDGLVMDTAAGGPTRGVAAAGAVVVTDEGTAAAGGGKAGSKLSWP